ncbi:MAG: hypothetical protein ACPGXK_14905 [Phycisphaerae bacterium]
MTEFETKNAFDGQTQPAKRGIGVGTIALISIMSVLTLGTTWASRSGLGVPKPDHQPPSIREESARVPRSGHSGTRFFFIGGGIHRGK